MSRIISGSIWGLALVAVAAFSAVPASAAETGGESNAPHILLVRGGGGGGGGGGHGFGGGGFSGGGGRSFGGFSGGSGRSVSPAISGNGARSFSQGTRSFSGNDFANGNRSNFANGNRSNFGHDGYNHGGWNNGNWAWRGYGYGGWGGGWWGYPLVGWLGGYGWWYPGYYDYGSNDYPYYYGDNYAYADTGTPASTAVEPQQQPDQGAAEGQGSEYLDQAIQAFQAGNFSNAMRMAEHAIVDSPRDAEAHEVVSLAAMANKDYRTAATEAHAVIALGGVPSWNQVYAIYQNVDTYTSQLRGLEDYVKAHPKSAEGQFLLGVQYMTTGYSSDAHDHLTLAAQLTPKDKIVQDLLKGAGGEGPATANRPGGAETK